METNQNRLTILTQSEIQDYFGIPRFTQDDRKYYFDILSDEKSLIPKNCPIHSKVNFILQLGYFKAKRMFFNFEMSEAEDDVAYIFDTYFPYEASIQIKPLSKPTRLKHQLTISRHYQYKKFEPKIATELSGLAKRVVRRSAKPVFILRELLGYLEKHQIIPPAYSTFQDLIGKCLSAERSRISGLLESAINVDVKRSLVDLLSDESTGLQWVTQLKKEPKDFSYKEIKLEAERAKQLKVLYDFSQDWLPSLHISNESIRYYAALVEYYSVYKLRRFDVYVAYFYLLCYAYHRTHVIHDNLVDALISNVRHYEEEAKKFAKNMIYKRKTEVNENVKMTGKILDLFLNTDIEDSVNFGEVRAKAFEVLSREQIKIVSTFIGANSFDEEEFQWQHLEQLSGSFKKNLRQIIRILDFKSHNEGSSLIDAAVFLQACFDQGKILRRVAEANFPVDFVSASSKKYLYTKPGDSTIGKSAKKLNPDRYEFSVYKTLRKAFESGDIFNQRTIKYRSFTDYLIAKPRWETNKQQVLEELELPLLIQPIEQTLKELKTELEEKIARVNRRIINRENKDVKFSKNGDNTAKWTLPYKREEDEENHRFYHCVPTIGIASLLRYVNKKTGFLDGFTHVLDRYTKGSKDEKTLLATVIALGTNMGLGRMGEISDVNYQDLQGAYRNFFRIETLKEANDLIANATAQLPVFRHYDIEKDVLHSSSDGQRLETQRNTINARHASKYFGLKKGISALALIGNHVPINAKVIGTHEHESYFVFDLLYNNTTDIVPDRHSVDTHGTNQVNFWILHVFGYQFAPRYRNFPAKTENIIGFSQPGEYDEAFPIKPSRKVNEELIIEEWPSVQHIMASLGQKETTQSAIVRKLSSYARQNKTKKALWELDNILRSIYMLDYIDDKSLRQHVTRALNRGEAYHRLKKAIAHANGGKLRVKTEIEQHLIHECTRLISNAIIYFNAEMLSNLLMRGIYVGKHFDISNIGKISPVAWQHINFYGHYEFNEIAATFDIDELISSIDLADYFTEVED